MAKDLKKVGVSIARVQQEPVKFERQPTDDPDIFRFAVVTGTAGGLAGKMRQFAQGRSSGMKPTGVGVLLSTTWREIPMCSCAMGKRSRGQDEPFCDHVVSLLLQHPEFEYQLYDMFV